MDSRNLTQPTISDHNSGPAVAIVTLLLLVISALALVARLSTKWAVSHRLNLDDVLLGIALIFSIGNGISTCLEASNGLGSPIVLASKSELSVVQKTQYTSELCYIGSLCLSKLSMVTFIHMLTPDASNRLRCVSYGAFTIAWTVIALIACALQCRAPRVWLVLGDKCFNQYAFWTTFLVLEMVINCILIMFPVYMLWRLQVRQIQKIAIWCCFGARIFVIAALIVQAALYSNAWRSSDFLYHSWSSTMASEVVLCLSYTTTCLPYLRPFLESLDSGVLRHEGIRRLGQTEADSKAYGSEGPSFAMLNFIRSGDRSLPSKRKEVTIITGTESREVDEEELQVRKMTPSLESNASGAIMIKKRIMQT